jgi:hypothetical protein
MRVLRFTLLFAILALQQRAFAADSAHDPRAGAEIGVRIGGGVLGRSFVSPVELDVGYRITRFAYAGTYLQRGAGITTAGGQVRFHLTPARVIDPWIGVGGGYAWVSSAPNTLIWGQVAVGTDTLIAPAFVIGPYASASFAEVGHHWFHFGLRGALTL